MPKTFGEQIMEIIMGLSVLVLIVQIAASFLYGLYKLGTGLYNSIVTLSATPLNDAFLGLCLLLFAIGVFKFWERVSGLEK